MDAPQLILTISFCMLAVGLLSMVARAQSKREVKGEQAKDALRSLVLWWVMLAVYFGYQAVLNLSRFWVEVQPPYTESLQILQTALIMTAFAFLLDYLLFIVHGDLRWRRRITAYYGILFVLLAMVGPLVEVLDEGAVSDNPAFAITTMAVIIALMMIPILVALGLQVRFFFAANEATVQYRIVGLSMSVLVFLTVLSVNDDFPEDLRIGSAVIEMGGVILMGILPLVGAWIAYRAYAPAAWVAHALQEADQKRASASASSNE